jgi:glycosyltransferase involved in cell wall biosynthesis
MVLKEIPEAKFLVVGGGSQEAKLQEQAKSLGISQNVKFTGRIPNDELPEYLNSADIYVSTSLSDAGLASSTAEAMACGLPVIITDFGDNKKWVEDGTNGFLVPLRNPQVLASKIIQLIRNKEIRDRFGRINRQIIEERNDWQKEMRKIEELYQVLMIRSKK